MLIILLRHGPAGHHDPSAWPDDRLRPLTERGARRSRRAVRGLCSLLAAPVRIITSPLERCAATAAILRDALGDDAVMTADELLAPGLSVRDVMRRLGQLDADETVVLVGHEPDLGRLAGVMLFGAPRALPLKKAGACAIEFPGTPASGEGELKWFLGPRVLHGLRRSARKSRAGSS
jgi:phosphohistidine phosphatase